jgi:MFS family permease
MLTPGRRIALLYVIYTILALGAYVAMRYIRVLPAFVPICVMISGGYVVRRLLHPFPKRRLRFSDYGIFWRMYAGLAVANLFALAIFSWIDVSIHQEVTNFFRYWFWLTLLSGILIIPLGIYDEIKALKTSKNNL